MFQGAKKCAEFVEAQFPLNLLHFSLGFPQHLSAWNSAHFSAPQNTHSAWNSAPNSARVLKPPYPRNVGKFYEPFILKNSASVSGPRMEKIGKFLGALCFQILDMFRSLECSIQQIFSGPMT